VFAVRPAVSGVVTVLSCSSIDYLHVANWSLWSDIKIVLRTVSHVIGRRGLCGNGGLIWHLCSFLGACWALVVR
jgi:hypothetical protein